MAKRISELTPDQAEDRRAQRRKIYARNPAVQRSYSQNYRKRKANPAETPNAPRASYSPQDYAEEWEWLTNAGVLSTDIIAKSTPSKAWFKKHITSLVKYANCPGCGRKYVVANSGTILICSRTCPKHNYTEDYHVSRGRRELELTCPT